MVAKEMIIIEDGIIRAYNRKFFVEDLPEGLKTKIQYLTKTIQGLKSIEIDVWNPANSIFVIPPVEKGKTDKYFAKRFGQQTQEEFLWLANLLRWFFKCCLSHCLPDETKGFPEENQCVHCCPFRTGCDYLYYQYHYLAIFTEQGSTNYPFPPKDARIFRK
jgi:hypothetical protein